NQNFSSSVNIYDTLTYIKLIMKITAQLFQNAGTSDAMRGFLEGHFPTAIKKILIYSPAFSPPILAHTFAAIADYVHAEPANLPFVIEAGLFDGFVQVMKRELPPAADFLQEMPALIEAFLLSPDLLIRVKEEQILDKIFYCFEMVNLCDTITAYDISSTYGMFLEKTARHHPASVPTIRANMLRTLDSIARDIPNTPSDLMQALLENLFRMISCSVIYNPGTTHFLLGPDLLLSLTQILGAVDAPADSELYAISMEILRTLAAEPQIGAISLLLSRVKEALGRNEPKVAQRLLVLVNSMLFAGTSAHPLSLSEVVCTLNTIQQVFRSLQAGVGPSTTTNDSLFALQYALGLGLLRSEAATLPPSAHARGPEHRSRSEWGTLPELVSTVLPQAIDNLKWALQTNRSLSAHLQALKNYFEQAKSCPGIQSLALSSLSIFNDFWFKISSANQNKHAGRLANVLQMIQASVPATFRQVNPASSELGQIEDFLVQIISQLVEYLDAEGASDVLLVICAVLERDEAHPRHYDKCYDIYIRLLESPKADAAKSFPGLLSLVFQDKKEIERHFKSGHYLMLQQALSEETCILECMRAKLPDLIKESLSSSNPDFILLTATTLYFASALDDLQGTYYTRRLVADIDFSKTTPVSPSPSSPTISSPNPNQSTTSSPNQNQNQTSQSNQFSQSSPNQNQNFNAYCHLLEAQSTLVHSVLRAHTEGSVSLTVSNLSPFLDTLFAVAPLAPNRRELAMLIDLILRRALATPISTADLLISHVRTYGLCRKYRDKTPAGFAQILSPIATYSPTVALSFAAATVEQTPSGTLIFKPPENPPRSPQSFAQPNQLTPCPLSLFRDIFLSSAKPKPPMEAAIRAHALCQILTALPHVLSSLTDPQDMALSEFFISQYGKSQAQDPPLAHLTSRLITLLIASAHSHQKSQILSQLSKSLDTNPAPAANLLLQTLQARSTRSTFEETLSSISSLLPTLIKTVALLPDSPDLPPVARLLEYLTRVLALGPAQGVFEEPAEEAEEEEEGYMEDFDTDETMDSDQTAYDSTEDLGGEDSFASDSPGYSSGTATDSFPVQMEAEAIDPSAAEFLRGLSHGTRLVLGDTEFYCETAEIFKEALIHRLIQILPKTTESPPSLISTSPPDQNSDLLEDEDTSGGSRGRGSRTRGGEGREGRGDTHYTEMDSYDSLSASQSHESFASDEEFLVGAEDGEVPGLDAEVLNGLPEEILRDTVEHFYQERIASSSVYRPISLVFLDSLRDDVRLIFEEEEAAYFAAFAEAAPSSSSMALVEPEVSSAAVREGPLLVETGQIEELVDAVVSVNGPRRLLYDCLWNIGINGRSRRDIMCSLMRVVQSGRVKKGFDAAAYLCGRTEEFALLFRERSLLEEVFLAVNKRSASESIKLLSLLGPCFSLSNNFDFYCSDDGSITGLGNNFEKEKQNNNFEKKDKVEKLRKYYRSHEGLKVALPNYMKVFEFEVPDDVFEGILAFTKASGVVWYAEYLAYLLQRASEILIGLSQVPVFSTTDYQKELTRLVRVLLLAASMDESEEVRRKLREGLEVLERHEFWRTYFKDVLPLEREPRHFTSVLPLFKAFVLTFCPLSSVEGSYLGSNGFFMEIIEKEKDLLNAFISLQPNLLFEAFKGLPSSVLDFDNKRVFFYKLIKSSDSARPEVPLTVDRNHVFEDSFHGLMRLRGEEIRDARFNIKFAGERGVDAGGLTREWFGELSREMFNPGYALFDAIGLAYQPSPNSHVNPEHLLYFKFIGRVLGKAVHDGATLDCHFTRAVYKRLLGRPVTLSDIEAVDPAFHRSLTWILNNEIDGVLDLTFAMEHERFGATEIVDLKPNGKDIAVTDANKQEYVDLTCAFKLSLLIDKQLAALSTGFFEILPAERVRMFNERELELLISGLPEIDVDDWRNNTLYAGYTSSSQVVRWFWRAVRDFSVQERAKLLQFCTGSSKLPLEGFAGLKGQNGNQRFQIYRAPGGDSRLPTAHTCFNQLDLPEYTSYEELLKRMRVAIQEGASGFWFA
ncbi:E3 ubiquitin-protein ligase HUWE1, partial [Nematocida homosporus]|uniref:E3 ubiquitin-protein ligase HUWE1 n=1 Tax=Nematocida homosporus TaxID=1912981 RepID=UPI002220498E